MALCMIYPVTEEYPPTFESFFPPQGLSLSIPFILTSDVGGSEIEKSLGVLHYSHTYHLTLCNLSGFTLWGEDHWHLPEDARGMDNSRVFITSRQAAQGHLQLHTHITGPDTTTNDVLVSLTLPSCSTVHRFYMNCTCLGRALHTAGLPGGDFPFTLTPTHTFAHHILMLQQILNNFPLKHGHISSKSHYFSFRISSAGLKVSGKYVNIA